MAKKQTVKRPAPKGKSAAKGKGAIGSKSQKGFLGRLIANKGLLTGVIVIVALGLGFGGYALYQDLGAGAAGKARAAVKENIRTYGDCMKNQVYLQKGSKGGCVKRIQGTIEGRIGSVNRSAKLDFPNVRNDGYYDQAEVAAIKAFQALHKYWCSPADVKKGEPRCGLRNLNVTNTQSNMRRLQEQERRAADAQILEMHKEEDALREKIQQRQRTDSEVAALQEQLASLTAANAEQKKQLEDEITALQKANEDPGAPAVEETSDPKGYWVFNLKVTGSVDKETYQVIVNDIRNNTYMTPANVKGKTAKETKKLQKKAEKYLKQAADAAKKKEASLKKAADAKKKAAEKKALAAAKKATAAKKKAEKKSSSTGTTKKALSAKAQCEADGKYWNTSKIGIKNYCYASKQAVQDEARNSCLRSASGNIWQNNKCIIKSSSKAKAKVWCEAQGYKYDTKYYPANGDRSKPAKAKGCYDQGSTTTPPKIKL